MNKIDITPKIGAWGIWDKLGEAWIGSELGPQTYQDEVINGRQVTGETLARMAATIFSQRCEQPFRFAARQYLSKSDTKKDNIELPKSLNKALNEILTRNA